MYLKTNKFRRIVFVGALSLLLLWLLFSTRIIVMERNKDIGIEMTRSIEPKQMGLSFLWMDQCEKTDSLYDTVIISGAIYNISYATDDEASRSLLLVSDDTCYHIQLSEYSHWTRSIYQSIPNKQKDFVGFNIEFCPLGLKNGEYSVILQVEENGIPVTRADSGYKLKKVRGHVTVEYDPSDPVAEPFNDAVGWVNGGINSDETNLDETGNLNLKGWAIIDDVEAMDTEIFVKVIDGGTDLGTFSTTKENITYIADYFDNEQYYGAGFIAKIPGITSDKIKLYIYAKYNDEIYKCAYHFEPDDSFVFNLISDID